MQSKFMKADSHGSGQKGQADMTVDTDFEHVAAELEKKELDPRGNVLSSELYAKLLALYLRQNDLANARFLWKRIPETMKSQNNELAQIWGVGKAMFLRDVPAMYKALDRPWSPDIAPIMSALVVSARERHVELIATAYTSLSAANLSAMLGLDEPEAIAYVKKLNWTVDNGYVQPVKRDSPTPVVSSTEQQIKILTDFLSFLEN